MGFRIIDVPQLNQLTQSEDGYLTIQELGEATAQIETKIQDASGQEKKDQKELLKIVQGLKSEMASGGEQKVGLRGFNTIPGARLFATPREKVISTGNSPSPTDLAFPRAMTNPNECAEATPRGPRSTVYDGNGGVHEYNELAPNTEVYVVNDGADKDICVTGDIVDPH